jgi:hypothetical protein
LGGYDELFRLYSGAASVVNGLENGEPLTALSGFFGFVGEQDLANFFGYASSLQEALDNGDELGAITSISNMAGSLGYDGLATIGNAVDTVNQVVSMVGDLSNLKEACQDGMPWDIICVVPQVSGGVCSEQHPVIRSCQFDYGLPTFNVNAICDDMISDMGFKIDCSCVYTCPNFPYTAVSQQSLQVGIENLYLLLDSDELKGLRQAAGLAGLIYSLSQADIDSDLMQYCSLDP